MRFKEILFLTDCHMTDAVLYAALCYWARQQETSVTIIDIREDGAISRAEMTALQRPGEVSVVCSVYVHEHYLTRTLKRHVYAAAGHIDGVLNRFLFDEEAERNFRWLYDRLPLTFQLLVMRLGITEAGNMVAAKIHSLTSELDFRRDAEIAALTTIRV